MKKYISALKIIAITILITGVFSGCGIIDAASRILKGDNSAPTETTAPFVNDGSFTDENYQTEDFTYSAVISNPDDTTTPNTTVASNQASDNSQNISVEKPTNTPSDNTNTQKPVETTREEAPSDYFKEGEYVGNIQDALFATKDPNTAGKILTLAGFDYDPEQDIYYSTLNPLQRNFGFNNIYDLAAPRTGMIYSTSRIFFTYDDKDWMMQIWKGQYGITSGGEVGMYNKPTDRVMKHFDCVTDEEMITMKMDFYNQGKLVFTRGPEKHWWLTGFKIFNIGIPFLIELDITVEFPNRKMANAFQAGLKEAAKSQIVDPMTFTRDGNTFNIVW